MDVKLFVFRCLTPTANSVQENLERKLSELSHIKNQAYELCFRNGFKLHLNISFLNLMELFIQK